MEHSFTPQSRTLVLVLSPHEAVALLDIVQSYAEHYGVSCCQGVPMEDDAGDLLARATGTDEDAVDLAKDGLAAKVNHMLAATIIEKLGEAPTDHAIVHYSDWFPEPEPVWLDEDAACGKGCGEEPMGCAACMRDGGPGGMSKDDYMELMESRDMDDPDCGY